MLQTKIRANISGPFPYFPQTATASHNLGTAFAERVKDDKDAFEKMVLNSYKETDTITLYSNKVMLSCSHNFAKFL